MNHLYEQYLNRTLTSEGERKLEDHLSAAENRRAFVRYCQNWSLLAEVSADLSGKAGSSEIPDGPSRRPALRRVAGRSRIRPIQKPSSSRGWIAAAAALILVVVGLALLPDGPTDPGIATVTDGQLDPEIHSPAVQGPDKSTDPQIDPVIPVEDSTWASGTRWIGSRDTRSVRGYGISPLDDGTVGYLGLTMNEAPYPWIGIFQNGELHEQLGVDGRDYRMTLRSMTRSVDGMMVIAGEVRKKGGGSQIFDAFVAAVDRNHQPVWGIRFDGPKTQDRFLDVVTLSDGTFLAIGESTSGYRINADKQFEISDKGLEDQPGFSPVFMVRISAAGRVLTFKAFDPSELRQDGLMQKPNPEAHVLPNGNLLMTGTSTIENGEGTDIFAMNLDQDLNVVWCKSYRMGAHEKVQRSILGIDGNIWIVGTTGGRVGSQLISDAIVFRIGPDGAVGNAMKVDAKLNLLPQSLSELPNGDKVLVAMGVQQGTRGDYQTVDGLVVRLTGNNRLSWARRIRSKEIFESAGGAVHSENSVMMFWSHASPTSRHNGIGAVSLIEAEGIQGVELESVDVQIEPIEVRMNDLRYPAVAGALKHVALEVIVTPAEVEFGSEAK